MRARQLAVLLALCSATGANAQNCTQLYDAVKREAMYCDFFCDQKRLAPLQHAYEKQCIVIAVPLELLASFENAPDEAGWQHALNNGSAPSRVPILLSD